jgi:hypothetical protein
MKTEKIIIRLSKDLKNRFKAKCNSENIDMSDRIRKFIEENSNPNKMDMMKIISDKTEAVSEELLLELKKTILVNDKETKRRDVYESGRDIKIGERVLYGLLTSELENNFNKIYDNELGLSDMVSLDLKLIKFNIDEMGVIYELTNNEINKLSDTIYLKKIYHEE